jgi:hypothetical protein
MVDLGEGAVLPLRERHEVGTRLHEKREARSEATSQQWQGSASSGEQAAQQQ